MQNGSKPKKQIQRDALFVLLSCLVVMALLALFAVFAALARPYIKFGEERGSETAQWEISLDAETANKDEDEVTITTVGDLRKGFEKVKHWLVILAAKKHQYPMILLKMTLDMYRAVKRLVWNTAVGRAIRCKESVVAGCTHEPRDGRC